MIAIVTDALLTSASLDVGPDVGSEVVGAAVGAGVGVKVSTATLSTMALVMALRRRLAAVVFSARAAWRRTWPVKVPSDTAVANLSVTYACTEPDVAATLSGMVISVAC